MFIHPILMTSVLFVILRAQRVRVAPIARLDSVGDPKGVILTHGNFIADIAGAFVNGIKTVPTDTHISYLPLAHVLERVVVNALWCNGGAAGFFRGDVRQLFDDITVCENQTYKFKEYRN
jgi:acyl-CoA synthetase (AMP-forming)/AMP-acid ligase II